MSSNATSCPVVEQVDTPECTGGVQHHFGDKTGNSAPDTFATSFAVYDPVGYFFYMTHKG